MKFKMLFFRLCGDTFFSSSSSLLSELISDRPVFSGLRFSSILDHRFSFGEGACVLGFAGDKLLDIWKIFLIGIFVAPFFSISLSVSESIWPAARFSIIWKRDRCSFQRLSACLRALKSIENSLKNRLTLSVFLCYSGYPINVQSDRS